jgi:hypothetical protein
MSRKSITQAREALIAADRLRRADTHSTYESGAWPAWQRAAVAYHLVLTPEDEVWRADPSQPALRSIAEIRERAEKLEEASRAVHAFPLRDTDADQYVQQSAAAGWFHEMFRAMYPPAFWRSLHAVKSGDRTDLEPIMRFLEADPWCFRSGYVKADLIRAVIRLDLTEAEKDRLRRVVLLVVDDPVLRRELRPYARLAVAVAGPGLVEGLEARSSVESPVIRSNARWILDALAGRQLPRMSRIASARFRRPS